MQALIIASLVVLECILPTLASTIERSEKVRRIVGGSASSPGAHPYMASIQNAGKHICAGTLYKADTIITAAHCFEGPLGLLVNVQLGLHDMANPDSNLQTIVIATIIKHPSWDPQVPGFPNDVAVVKLAANATLNARVQTIGIGSVGDNEIVTMLGWGYTTAGQGGSLATELQEMDMPTISTAECQAGYSDVVGADIFDTNVCAFDNTQRSSCTGDKGGPMTFNGALVGTASWELLHCHGTHPSVYTRLFDFQTWIDNAV